MEDGVVRQRPIVRASGSVDDDIIPWLKQAEDDTITMDDLRHTDTIFATLDRKPAASLNEICDGEFERRLSHEEQRQMAGKQQVLRGRQILWLIYQHLRTNPSLEGAYSINDLFHLQPPGDAILSMEKFRNSWNEVVSSQRS